VCDLVEQTKGTLAPATMGPPMRRNEPLPAGLLFIVNLEETSGTNGDKTHAASYVYTVKNLAGNELATGQSPERPRPYGTRSAATKGYAYKDSSGTWHLAEAWEGYGTGGCT
jgi:hypothetical protein